jgi:hypothetical protein
LPLPVYFLAPSLFILPTFLIAQSLTKNIKLSSSLVALHYGSFIVGETINLFVNRYL